MGVTNELPPKRDVAIALLESSSVYVHLDPRQSGVMVPAWFKKQPQLVLQVGLNMPVPIPDLNVGEDALSCTLSFNRRPEYCVIPWSAVYGLVGEDGRGMIWPEDVPPEVAAQAQGRAAAPKDKEPRKLRAVPEGGEEPKARPSAEQPTSAEAAPVEVASAEVASVDAASQEGSKGPAKRSKSTGKSTSGDVSRAPKAAPAAEKAPGPSSDAGAGRGKRELPPYLRVVK